MAAPFDPNPRFQDYPHPERLVSTEWLAEHLDYPSLRIFECNADSLLYDIGHIPGALRIDWQKDLFDPITHDVVNGHQFATLMRHLGVRPGDTVIFYGDKGNRWAAHAAWVFTLFGHADVRLLDGGRDAWFMEERPSSFAVRNYPVSDYPLLERKDKYLRVYQLDVLELLGRALILDVRDEKHYRGEMDGSQGIVTSRYGHIPTAHNIPWDAAIGPDSRFRSRKSLRETYGLVRNIDPRCDVVTYCDNGERASHTWFVLTYLLGYDNVFNYDGSWREWGNSMRMPIVRDSQPGKKPPRPQLHARR